MSGEINLLSIIRSDDPLSDNSIGYLLNHKEEDKLVDYKEAFDPTSDKSWLDLNVDVVAFANTYGGFLVYGVKDKSFEITGLTQIAFEKLCDIKQVLEKVNRYVQPKFSSIRSKGKEIDGKKVVFIHIPQSKQHTHIFVSNADIQLQSGESKVSVRQGTIYVRKSGTNQILTSDDFEELLQRRFAQIKEKMLDGIARVVKADIDQEVMIVAADKNSSDGKYKITDAPDAMPIKGMSFTATPETEEEKISAWIAINKSDPDNFPTPKSLMETYSKRKNIHMSGEHKKWLAYFSLVKGRPVFFYLQNLSKKDVFEILEKALDSKHAVDRHYVLDISAFFGKTIYDKLFGMLRQRQKHAEIAEYPGDLGSVFKTPKFTKPETFEEEANNLSAELVLEQNQRKLYRLRKLDCGLYAPF